MTLPTVHLNGTGAADLIEQNLEAYRAVEAAIEKLQAACPNARDYYTQDPQAFGKARDEHVTRLRALTTVSAELMTIIEHVDNLRDMAQTLRDATHKLAGS